CEKEGQRFALCEVLCWLGRALICTDELPVAEEVLGRASDILESGQVTDVEPLFLLTKACLLDAQGSRPSAASLLDRAIELAHAEGDHFRVAEAAAAYCAMASLSTKALTNVRASLDAIREGLGPVLSGQFFAELPPALRQISETAGRTAPAVALRRSGSFSSVGEERLFRLLSITAQLAREPDGERFLARAIDAAVELSGAERGFLLLREAARLQVAVSRDVDGEPIRRAALKVSMTVAETVAESGEVLVTSDAGRDDRLTPAKSVVQLSLQSILCLPIRAMSQVIGVLYLDHRFKHDAFSSSDVRFMSSFADQLAVGLIHLEQLRELEGKNRALEKRTEALEAALQEQRFLASQLQEQFDGLASEVRTQRSQSRDGARYENIVAKSGPMQSVLDRLDQLVGTEVPVLITGESGTGKELIARAIHFNGPRRDQPFIPINCGAIPEQLLESELFGHKKGAFTGADRDKLGLFRAADGGTVFLDELGEMPLASQVKLLRVLQDKRVRPVGGEHDLPVNVRLVAATNRDVLAQVEKREFREDLYYRLAAVTLELSPLRERREDIPALVERFAERHAQRNGGEVVRFSPDALRSLFNHDWPGNVRQLENVVQVAIAFSRDGIVNGSGIDELLTKTRPKAQTGGSRGKRGPRPKVDAAQLRDALRECQGDIDQVAALLGVSSRSIYRYMKRWGIETS
ncbi:MAG: sigma 54-interacting transcriptional regulator, partial [Myxococcales bacterium]|nr:sigma 54-interacting transcriptional regulator [Myxococcales bacterium]